MPRASLLFLTYLAQVRQLHFRNAWLVIAFVPTMRHFLHIKPSKKHGIFRKETVIIGIARVVDLVGQKQNMVVWSRVAGNWQKNTIYISSRPHAGERK